MQLVHRASVPAERDRVWDFVMDVERVSACVPGVQGVSRVDDTTYQGTLRVRVGPIGLNLQGNIVIAEQDRAAGRALMTVQAADRKVGGAVSAKMTMQLAETAPNETELTITTDANVLGKLGEFGQPVIKKKADQLMDEFARNVQRAVGAGA